MFSLNKLMAVTGSALGVAAGMVDQATQYVASTDAVVAFNKGFDASRAEYNARSTLAQEIKVGA